MYTCLSLQAFVVIAVMLYGHTEFLKLLPLAPSFSFHFTTFTLSCEWLETYKGFGKVKLYSKLASY